MHIDFICTYMQLVTYPKEKKKTKPGTIVWTLPVTARVGGDLFLCSVDRGFPKNIYFFQYTV